MIESGGKSFAFHHIYSVNVWTSYNKIQCFCKFKMSDAPRKLLSTAIQTLTSFLKTVFPKPVHNNFQVYHRKSPLRSEDLPGKSSETVSV